IISLCNEVFRLRRLLHIPGSARLVTRDMMEGYGRLAELADPAQREAGLDGWLERYGHRGPMGSDVGRSRFVELREVLRRDLAAAQASPDDRENVLPRSVIRRIGDWFLSPLFWLDKRREWFRDEAMRQSQRLRARMLEEGRRLVAVGELD